MTKQFVPVGDGEDIPPGACRALSAAGHRVIVAHLPDGFYAIEDRCSHLDSPLNAGRLYRGGQIACPVHGARFDIRTGAAKSPPAFQPVATYPVRVVDGRIEIAIDAEIRTNSR
jgi:nitrite reductase/ring-hydroxylating ferredoxin subunit